MEEIKTDLEFKTELMRCTKYMTSKNHSEVIMEVTMESGKVEIQLKLI